MSSLHFDTSSNNGLGIIHSQQDDSVTIDRNREEKYISPASPYTSDSPSTPPRPKRRVQPQPSTPAADSATSPSSPKSVNTDSLTSAPPSPLRADRAESLPLGLGRPLDDEDDEQFRSQRSSSESLDSRAFQRRLSRKLPPKLTESLELLSLAPTPPELSPALTIQPSTFGSCVLDADTPRDPDGSPRSKSIPLETGLVAKKALQHQKDSSISPASMPSTPTARRIISNPSLRTSTASSNGTHLVTPSSSVHGHNRFSYDAEGHPISCSSGSASTCGTWSMDGLEEPYMSDKRHETRKQKKERKLAEKAAFDVDTPPSMRALYNASMMDVIGEDGEKVKFGDVVRRGKTIVVFIRHWFCPLCAQYMQSIVSQVTPEALEEADVELVIIGNGSQKMLPAYKNKAMKCPFKMYTDPTLSLYRALGLTRQTGDAGLDSEAGDYLVQTPLEATLATMKRATQMPLFANPGHFTQLGGELIFNGTLNVSYTHRMINTRAHAPIRDICALAGVSLEWIHYEPGPMPPAIHRHSIISEEDEEAEEGEMTQTQRQRQEEVEWRKRRDEELARIQAMKEARRTPMKFRTCDMRREVTIVGEENDSLEEMRNEFGHFDFE